VQGEAVPTVTRLLVGKPPTAVRQGVGAAAPAVGACM